jgi:hypothetical protein
MCPTVTSPMPRGQFALKLELKFAKTFILHNYIAHMV